ncbi:unnamed protein product, partial [Polarella glacialis]
APTEAPAQSSSQRSSIAQAPLPQAAQVPQAAQEKASRQGAKEKATAAAGPSRQQASSAGGGALGSRHEILITPQRGPGADGDPEGALYGAEILPMVGAAGCLVLPKRQTKPVEVKDKHSKVDPTDVIGLCGDGELSGWGPDADHEVLIPWRRFTDTAAERALARYVKKDALQPEITKAISPDEIVLDIEQVRVLTMDQPPVKPVQ